MIQRLTELGKDCKLSLILHQKYSHTKGSNLFMYSKNKTINYLFFEIFAPNPFFPNSYGQFLRVNGG